MSRPAIRQAALTAVSGRGSQIETSPSGEAMSTSEVAWANPAKLKILDADRAQQTPRLSRSRGPLGRDPEIANRAPSGENWIASPPGNVWSGLSLDFVDRLSGSKNATVP